MADRGDVEATAMTLAGAWWSGGVPGFRVGFGRWKWGLSGAGARVKVERREREVRGIFAVPWLAGLPCLSRPTLRDDGLRRV